MYRYASNDTTILRIKEMYVPLQFKYLMVHTKCNIMLLLMTNQDFYVYNMLLEQ